MSDFRAVATVTATLQSVLQEAVQADVAGATVTTAHPAEGEGTNLPETGVNVFLYQVAPNATRRNQDLPSRRTNGEITQRPAAALMLNYLFSFYGTEMTLEPQRLLGSTVAYMHSRPLLTRDQIRAVVADATKPYLIGSDLADAPDMVRFTPVGLTLDELSRLWSVFFQVDYVLSVVYQASVVLLERAETPMPALPTRDFELATLPLDRPVVTGVAAAAGPDASIVPGASIVIAGRALDADVAAVEVDGTGIATTEVRTDHINATLPSQLAAGPHVLQVRHGAPIGAPGVPHLVLDSDPAAFVVTPSITQTAGADDITVTDLSGPPSARSAIVAVGIAPPAGRGQTVTLELLHGATVAHTFIAPPRDSPAATTGFPIAGVAAGDYLIRVRVDGAASALRLGPDGAPTGPEVTIG
jgi:Pvc16 N-terminal domain